MPTPDRLSAILSRQSGWTRTFFAILATAWLLLTGVAMAGEPAASRDDRLPGEAALLGRLMAPCCWTQTLDVHSGSTPDALRAEIHARLATGEPPRAIEDDLVSRYGPRLRADSEESPLRWISVGLGITTLVAAIGLAFLIRRWTRRTLEDKPTQTAPREAPREAGDPWDERLDDELRAMD